VIRLSSRPSMRARTWANCIMVESM